MLANTNSGPLSLVALGTSKSFQAQTLRLFRVPHSVVLQKFHLGFAASPELGSGTVSACPCCVVQVFHRFLP